MLATLKRIIGTTGLLAAALAVPAATVAAPAAAATDTTPWCTTSRLAITAGPAQGAAGTQWLPLRFTNTSATACRTSGYPRVAYFTAPDGEQVNDEATPEVIGTPQQLVLAPTVSASALVRMPRAGNYDPETCQPVPVAGIRVAPPNNLATVFLSFPTTACSVSGFASLGIRALELA